MDWRDIPSLSALRAFEATARTRGFSAAARELNVTHAAIAQHVRALEVSFGQKLVERQGREMVLTPAGRGLAGGLADGFGRISRAVQNLRDSVAERPVNVTLTPSFAENWLMPRLGQFWSRHPEIQIALLPNVEIVDLNIGAIDVGLRYGRGDWTGMNVTPLVSARHVVVAAPAFARGRATGDLNDLRHLPWLLDQEQWRWCEAKGLDPSTLAVTELATNALTLAGARAGYGVSVQPVPVVRDDLKSGRLVTLYEDNDPELGYFIVTPKSLIRNETRVFIRWLKETSRDADNGRGF